MSAPHIVIMAGGTGGHVFPALAVAGELRARGVSVSWLGTRRGMESRLVPAAGIDIDWLDIRGLRGNGALGWLLAPWRISRAVMQAWSALRARGADAVLGMGGFAAGPGGLAAWLLRRPLVIHEQNSVAGLTNRMLSRIATTVLEGFPNTFNCDPSAVYCGNPVRQDIAALPQPEDRFSGRKGPLRLLVLGGSQGARVINHSVVSAVAALPLEQRPLIRHQAGESHLVDTCKLYETAGVEAEVSAFIDDMAAAYAWADLVICRAGALTIAELAAAGVASLLVPYPYAVDDHQTHNAALLADANAAVLKQENELDAAWLTDWLANTDRNTLLAMAGNARSQARPEATAEVANRLMATLKQPFGTGGGLGAGTGEARQ